jgi:DNA uptake protein ComE-like DNA-binding protein
MLLFNSLQRLTIKKKILNNPYYRFQTIEEVKIAIELGIQIDANQADVDDWLRLPGISIHQARSLAELTRMGVQFLCLEDLAAALSVPIHRLKPLEGIVTFAFYAPESTISPQKIDPNIASVEQLTEILHIYPDLALKIVLEREEKGCYTNLADLQRRLCLNSQVTSQLMYYLNFTNRSNVIRHD